MRSVPGCQYDISCMMSVSTGVPPADSSSTDTGYPDMQQPQQPVTSDDDCALMPI